MGNPLFGMPQMPMNPLQRIGQIVSDVQKLQRNPMQIAQYLADHNRINQAQLSEMRSLQDPQQVGMYLMQHGLMNPQQVQQAQQTIVPQIQNAMKK